MSLHTPTVAPLVTCGWLTHQSLLRGLPAVCVRFEAVIPVIVVPYGAFNDPLCYIHCVLRRFQRPVTPASIVFRGVLGALMACAH